MAEHERIPDEDLREMRNYQGYGYKTDRLFGVYEAECSEHDKAKARIAELEKGLSQARIPILEEDEAHLKEFAQVHNARIDALFPKEGEE